MISILLIAWSQVLSRTDLVSGILLLAVRVCITDSSQDSKTNLQITDTTNVTATAKPGNEIYFSKQILMLEPQKTELSIFIT